MDAPAFLDPTRKPDRPALREWVAPTIKTTVGAALVWAIARLVPPAHPLLAGWVGMIGLALLLHFGTFHLLALAWRRHGVDAMPLMREPARSKSLAEFWSVRWNRGFHQLARDLLFRPATRARLRPPAALLATFLASGVVHESLISLPAGAGFGLPTLYFAIQGFAVLLERSGAGRRLGLTRGVRGRLFMSACTVLALPWLFPAPFVRRVVVPFLAAVGAL
jgi:alginate O-acetyltransferase complex protein AlgI